MKFAQFSLKAFSPVVLGASLLSACGGGGSDSPPTANQSGSQLSPAAAMPMTMTCVDGPQFQCSGGVIIRTDNGVAVTDSGVQAYGKSTSDLASPNNEKTTAFGMAPASGGTAEVRLAKDGNGVVSAPRLLLDNMGISWNGKDERPPILETFRTAQASVHLDPNGKVLFSALPGPSDYAYYDFADKGTAATQANYANNAYFPRGADNPPRCAKCDNLESTGAQYRQGDWRTGGSNPDYMTAVRLHGDGDVHAGNGRPDANGQPTILPGGSGIGVPFPGSKGYRGLDNWSLNHGNLATWATQDTVSIVEWAPGSDEHSSMRRGVVAFGDVTKPSEVPATGTATYSGIAYGWYTDGSITRYPAFFRAAVSVTVNFATRVVAVAVQNAFENVAALPPLPAANFQATPGMGATGASAANYFTGPLENGSLKGGVSGRYFGPVVASGNSGVASPAELGGAFSMSNASTGAAVIGGFIGRKS